MFQANRCEFLSPAKINVGNKALAHIPTELAALGTERPLLVTTKALARKGPQKAVINALRDSGISLGVYDGIGDRADMTTVFHLVDFVRDGGFDALMALGSGPVVHAAKVANIAVTENTRNLDPFVVKGERRIRPLKPLMVVPAMAGDGWEYTPLAFVERQVFSSPFLVPQIVVLEACALVPEIPSRIISDAMTTLTYAVEGFVGPWKNPFVDAYAHTAIEMVFQHLKKALLKRGWGHAREVLAGAAVMGGAVFSNAPQGLTHLLTSELVPKADCSPGLVMGILLPHVLDALSARDDFFVGELLLPLAGAEAFAITSADLRSRQALSMLQEFQFDLYQSTGKTLPMTLEDARIPREYLKTVAFEVSRKASFEMHGEFCSMILEHAFRGDAMEFD